MGVPALALWLDGPSCLHDLTDLESAQPVDEPGAEKQTERKRAQTRGCRAERDGRHESHAGQVAQRGKLEEVVEHHATPNNRSTTTSVRVPREPFTSTRSPDDDERLNAARRACAVGEAVDLRAGQTAGERALSQTVSGLAANNDQLVHAGGSRGAATRLVQLTARTAELEHLSEHSNPAAGHRRRRERREHRAYSGRARVVRVVDEAGAVREGANRATPGHRLNRRDASNDRVARNTELQRDRGRGEDVRELCLAGQWHAQVERARTVTARRRSSRRTRGRRRWSHAPSPAD